MTRARATGAPAVFWLDPERGHDAVLIDLVRRYLADEDTEGLDIRVLDPVAALSARHYTSHRKVRMSVVDSMGFADGIYEIDTTGDAPRVERVADRPRTQDDLAGKSMPAVELSDGADVALNVDSLGSLYLGAVKASTLHYAGLLRVRDDAALRDIQAQSEVASARAAVDEASALRDAAFARLSAIALLDRPVCGCRFVEATVGGVPATPPGSSTMNSLT